MRCYGTQKVDCLCWPADCLCGWGGLMDCDGCHDCDEDLYPPDNEDET